MRILRIVLGNQTQQSIITKVNCDDKSVSLPKFEPIASNYKVKSRNNALCYVK
jgi:hypothetical protein